MTPRQTFTALAASHRYRVRLDAEGWPCIPGRYGRLEYHDGRKLAVYTDGPGSSPGCGPCPESGAGKWGTRRHGRWSPSPPSQSLPP